MKPVFLIIFFVIISSCTDRTVNENRYIFLINDSLDLNKLVPKRDGLYTQTYPEHMIGLDRLYYLIYSFEVKREFHEESISNRKDMDYSEALLAYKKNYKNSFYKLLPTDFTENSSDKGMSEKYDVIVIDTLNKRAYTSKIIDSYRIE